MRVGMVYALQEIHRMLKPQGTLIDLRPAIASRPVLVDLSYATLHAGDIDSSSSDEDRRAADNAIQKGVDMGLFQLEHQTTFDIVTDLDTVDDLYELREAFDSSVLSDEVMLRVAELVSDEDDDYSIRVPRTMTIARYRKV